MTLPAHVPCTIQTERDASAGADARDRPTLPPASGARPATVGFPPALRHGPIEEVFPDVFVVRGTARLGPLLSITRNMTIVRTGDELALISAVRLGPEGERELERLGRIRHLVKIGDLHGSDDPYYVSRYRPTLWARRGAQHRLGLTTDRTLEEGGPMPIERASLFVFANATRPECALVLPDEGGILLTCDSVQNWEDFGGCSLAGKLMMRTMGFSPPAVIGPGWRRIAEPKDGPSFAGDFARLLDVPFRHLVSAHGYPLRDRAKEELRMQVARSYGPG